MKAISRDLRTEGGCLVYEEHKSKRRHMVCQEVKQEELAKGVSQLLEVFCLRGPQFIMISEESTPQEKCEMNPSYSFRNLISILSGGFR